MLSKEKKEILQIIKQKKLFAIDLDGVIYLNNVLANGADQSVIQLRQAGYSVAFVTNNSIKNKVNVCNKLNGLGVSCNVGEVYTSMDAALHFFKNNPDLSKGVFIVGSDELVDEMQKNDILLATVEDCSCVLVGFKRDLNYQEVTLAINALRRGVPFIICNRECNIPDSNGNLLPGCGYVVGAIEGSIGRKADVLIGKPDIKMLEQLFEPYQITIDEIVVIGDSYSSDIVMAQNANVPAIYIGGDVDDIDSKILCYPSLYEFTNDLFAL